MSAIRKLGDVRLAGVYGVIASFLADGISPTKTQIAQACGFKTTAQVDRLIRQLRKIGAIETYARYKDDSTDEIVTVPTVSSHRISNGYRLMENFDQAQANVIPGKRRPLSRALRAQVFAKFGNKCVVCGTSNNLQVDHIVPLAMGGSDTIENLQLLCASHNARKGDRCA